jgi:protein-disulfide isomerase
VSEQDKQVLNVVQNTDEGIKQFEKMDNDPSPMPSVTPSPTSSRTPRWFAPVWFLLGVIVGIAGFAAYTTLAAKPTTAAARDGVIEAIATLQAAGGQQQPSALVAGPVAAPTIDAVAMRGAARDGVLEAIATLQAGGGQQQPTAESQGAAAVDPSQFTLRAANTIASPNAKVTIVEFSDFQCPFCSRFHTTVEPQLMKDYVQTGQVTFVYKHSAFLGQESVWSAQAAECAADQGKFWEYHDLLFTRQNGENQGAFNKDKLTGFAKELKLDMTKFEPCLTNDETLARVQADTDEGKQAGVRGTPTFFINGQPLLGAQPITAFQTVLTPLLGQ